MRKLFALLALLVGCSALLVGCNAHPAPSTAPEPDAATHPKPRGPQCPTPLECIPELPSTKIEGGVGPSYTPGPGIAFDASEIQLAMTVTPGITCPPDAGNADANSQHHCTPQVSHRINGGTYRCYTDAAAQLPGNACYPAAWPTYTGNGCRVNNDAMVIGPCDGGGGGTTYTGHAPITVDGAVIGLLGATANGAPSGSRRPFPRRA